MERMPTTWMRPGAVAAALGVYGPTVYVIVGRTVCHAMDGPSHALPIR